MANLAVSHPAGDAEGLAWPPNVSGHMPALDGLRGLAILPVLLYHMTSVGPGNWATAAWGFAVRNFGWCGVDLFFVLSGFLITGLLYDSRGTRHYFRNFYARRVLRIFPLYYGYVAVVLVVLPIVYPDVRRLLHLSDGPWWGPASYWVYLQNYALAAAAPAAGGDWAHSRLLNHLWSLAIEEQFYIVWPLVIAACGRRVGMGVCLGTAMASFACRVAMAWYGALPLVMYVLTPSRLDALALGSFMALAARGPGGVLPLVPLARALAVGGAIVVAGLTIVERSFSYTMRGTVTVGLFALAVGFAGALVLAVAARPGSFAYRLLTTRTLRLFGRHSYALYVLHQGVILVASKTIDRLNLGSSDVVRQAALYTLGLSGSLAAAMITWYAYENVFLQQKRHFPTERSVHL